MIIGSELLSDGFIITDDFFDSHKIQNLEKRLVDLKAFDFNDQVTAINLLECDAVSGIANDTEVLALLKRISDKKMFPVKAFVLDKTEENNWKIPWHQDLKIAVQKRINIPGYDNWSVEAGILHVQPPVNVMEQLLTLRIHFDACTYENGAIHVIPESHKKGILNASEISLMVDKGPEFLCKVKKYGVMFMKPLLLHDSPPSLSLLPRRILQIEYGYELDGGLNWHNL